MDRAVATVEDLDGMPPVGKDGRTCVGFGMVETKVFGKMEEWITKSGIRDRSMSEDLKAKDKAPSSASKKRAAEDEDEEGQEGAVSQGKKRQQTEANGDDDSDDEEDEDFAPESEDEVMEEYDENYGNSESEGEGGQGTSKVAKHVEQDDDEVDLGEESLGEDDDDDEEEEGDDEGDEEGDEEEEEDELLDD